MKIKVRNASYEEACSKIERSHKKPIRPASYMRKLVRFATSGDLKKVNFSYHTHGMEALKKDEPCLILMNHSSFIDLKICAEIFADRPYNIVCTSDGFVGKEWLMRKIGCVPTQKFVTDLTLVKDLKYIVDELKTSILMFPEASYSFDGTATPLPDSVGKCIKILKVPVVMVRTYGAFSLDPLYNGLQLRNVDVSADVKYLLSAEDIKSKKADEINAILKEEFTFDHFRWQQENNIVIDEPFRADHLNRVLYKCPHCQTEGQMEGKGIHLICKSCGVKYELTELGFLKCLNAETIYDHIPDWYRWERTCVRQELENGSYQFSEAVDIYMLVDFRQIYRVGEGILQHSADGFTLDGCDGALHYTRSPHDSYSLYSDFYWYEIGDMICIGDKDKLFYCFPHADRDLAAKTRLATEELYKLTTNKSK